MSPDEQVALANGLMKNHIKPALGENQGAALFVFTYGEGGLTSYIGTSSRESLLKALKEMIAKWEEEAREAVKPSEGAIQMLPDELPKEMFDPTDGGKNKETVDQMMAIQVSDKAEELIKRYGTTRNALEQVVREINPTLHHLKMMPLIEKILSRANGDEKVALITAIIFTMKNKV